MAPRPQAAEFTGTGRFYTARRASGDWVWVTPDGEPFFITGIDKMQSIWMGCQVDLWKSTYGTTAPYELWADEMRGLLTTYGFNALGRDSHWDEARIDADHAPGTAWDFVDVVCNQQGHPTSYPMLDDFRFRNYLNQDCGSEGKPCIPHLINLHTVPRQMDFWGTGKKFAAIDVPDVWTPGFERRAEMVAQLVLDDPAPDAPTQLLGPCAPGVQINQGFKNDPWLVGLWLGNELFWGYRLTESGEHGLKGWLRALIATPYNDCKAKNEQAKYAFAQTMWEIYDWRAKHMGKTAVSLWNDTYGDGGTAFAELGQPAFTFEITSFTNDCDPTSLLRLFSSDWLDAHYPDRYVELYNLLGTVSSCNCTGQSEISQQHVFTERDSVDFSPLIEDATPVDLGYFLTVDDGRVFMKKVAHQFYGTMIDAILLYDSVPHHAIISDRFVGFSGAQAPFDAIIPAIASQYCDAISVNLYRAANEVQSGADDLASLYASLNQKRPILISEFSYHADNEKGYDCCMEKQGNEWIPHSNCQGEHPECADVSNYHYPEDFELSRRLISYQTYVETMAEARAPSCEHFICGVMWYHFFDHPFTAATDPSTMNPNHSGLYTQITNNWGMFDPRGNDKEHAEYIPYTGLLNQAATANCMAQRLRTGSSWYGASCNVAAPPPCQ